MDRAVNHSPGNIAMVGDGKMLWSVGESCSGDNYSHWCLAPRSGVNYCRINNGYIDYCLLVNNHVDIQCHQKLWRTCTRIVHICRVKVLGQT